VPQNANCTEEDLFDRAVPSGREDISFTHVPQLGGAVADEVELRLKHPNHDRYTAAHVQRLCATFYMPVGKIPSDSKAFQYLQQHGTLPVKALRKTGKQSPKVEAKWSLNLTDARYQRHLGKASPTDVLSPDKLWMCTPYNADWGLDQTIGALNVRLHHHDCTTNDCTTLR
jgi:hypothetical protein